ncbi:unnamed protein product, partial [Ixodes hexagonus]
MVSIKTTKESNTITVLTESEATNRALLGIKEIQITEQQPLPVQAYEAGPHLPRTVWYRRNVLEVYPYR